MVTCVLMSWRKDHTGEQRSLRIYSRAGHCQSHYVSQAPLAEGHWAAYLGRPNRAGLSAWGCCVPISGASCSFSEGRENLMSDKSTANGKDDSKGVEYFEEIPVTAEGNINIFAEAVRK